MSAAQAQTDFILFRIIDDDLEEPVEEFLISVGPVTATITIIDDDDGGEYYTHHLLMMGPPFWSTGIPEIITLLLLWHFLVFDEYNYGAERASIPEQL